MIHYTVEVQGKQEQKENVWLTQAEHDPPSQTKYLKCISRKQAKCLYLFGYCNGDPNSSDGPDQPDEMLQTHGKSF